MRVRLLFLVILLPVLCQTAYAQFIQDWGDVSYEQWEIDSFENDEDAHSIILFDFGESYINRNIDVVHKRHERIKILNPEQSDYTEIQIPVYDDRSIQRLRNVSAQTINRSSDGEIVTVEVEKDNIFTENSGDWEVTSFTFPALEPGSIVEYEYEIIYGNPAALPDFTFQRSSPILHSEYRVLVPDFFEFKAYQYGLQPYEQLNDNDKYMREMVGYNDLVPAKSNYTLYRTVLKNAPAIREEPYITSLINHKNHVKYHLSGYTNRQGFYTSYMNTWEEIADELLGSKQFGRSISSRRSLRRLTAEIIEGIDNDLEKARAIYDYVAANVQWNDRHSLATTERAHKIVKDLSGNSSDKAILLISMFRIADLQADPVIISTRKRGTVDWNYPSPNHFNHTVVLFRIDESIVLLDPLNEIIPFGMLNPSSINGSGLLITEDNAQIVDISPDNLSSTRTTTLLSLDEAGMVTAKLRSAYYGYDAIVHRELADDNDEQTYIEEYHLENAPGSTIRDYELLNLEDSSEPLIVKANIENEQYATFAGDMIYINPFFKDRISENPFSNPDREFPVEFNFGKSKIYTTTVKIPDGYEIVEIPENKSIEFSEKTQFSFIQQVSNNLIQMRMTIVNNEIEVGTDRYDDLRNYYASLTDFFNQQVVLQKTIDSANAVPGVESGN